MSWRNDPAFAENFEPVKHQELDPFADEVKPHLELAKSLVMWSGNLPETLPSKRRERCRKMCRAFYVSAQEGNGELWVSEHKHNMTLMLLACNHDDYKDLETSGEMLRAVILGVFGRRVDKLVEGTARWKLLMEELEEVAERSQEDGNN